jgi:TonB family protein
MTTLLELLDVLGRITWEPVWLPLLAWTALALPLWLVLKSARRLHPRADYRLSQVLLGTLPLGLLAAALGDLLPSGAAVVPSPALSVTVFPAPTPSVTVATGPAVHWTQAVGALVRLGHLASSVVAGIRVRRSLDRPAPTPLQRQATRLAQSLGMRRPLDVCVTKEAPVPVTLGGRRPLILLPPTLADDPEALRMSLLHECVHVRRYDDLAHLLERLVTALFAVHPLVHRIRHHVATARERACDAAVLADDDTNTANYARLLVAFAEGASFRGLSALSLSESPSALTTRLRTMRSTVSQWLSSTLGLGATLAAAGLLLLSGVVACSETTGPPPSRNAGEPGAHPSTSQAEEADAVDTPPKLAGGMTAVKESLTYPEMAKEAGIEGRVIVQFVVDKKGNVTEPTVTRGSHEILNEAALKAMRAQTFEPGTKQSEPVPVQMSFPVTFRLDDGSNQKPETSSDGSETESGGRLFEKAGIQLIRVLMNVEGDLLLDDEPIDGSNLTSAVRQRITKDAARVVLFYADGAPTDRVAAAEARLRSLDVQNVYVKKVE